MPETVAVALILFLGGTIYCQLYCLIAFQQMGGMMMPLGLSMQRSAADTIPALAAFELSKRALAEPLAVRRFARIAGSFLLVAALAVAAVILLRWLCDGGPMPVRLIVADRLSGLVVTAFAIIWANQQRRSTAESSRDADLDAAELLLPPSDLIDWVQAAGNYVEVHFCGRTKMFRMTLGQAFSALGSDHFVQIHRSRLVNRHRIHAFDGPGRRRHVRLTDGTLLKLGEAYRAKLFDE
jgi:hypothetical protein